MPTMDSGQSSEQAQSSQTQSQQARAHHTNRNPSALTGWHLMNSGRQAPRSGSIWTSNPLTDNLPSRDNTGATASTQRSSAAVAPENSFWPRPGPATWNSADSQQFRSSASRSTSPPTSLQNTANASPPFGTSRAVNQQNATFASSNFTPSYAGYADSAQGDYQQGFVSLQRGTQGVSSTYDDHESLLPPSRHSESEAPLQFGAETAGFGAGLNSHSRHPSRMSLSGATGYSQQQPASRSQSYSYHSTQAAAMDTIHAHLQRDSMQAGSPGSRASGAQASASGPSQLGAWRDFTPSNGLNFANGNMQEPRRDSLANIANSVHTSALNSPRNFGAQKQSDPWTPAAAPLDLEMLNRLQRSQGQLPRQTTQSPYLDASYSPYTDLHAQAQLMQMHAGYSLPFAQFQNYGYQTGQPLFPPTGPAGMIPRVRPADMTVSIRCQELEEFRRSSKSNKKWELKNVFGRVVEFAGDQQGSRFLQEKIPTANSDDRQRVFEEIMVNANALMVDVFGNYVVQQLFEHGTMVQKKMLAAKMQGHVPRLSEQLYGCRCVQEALEYVLVEQQVELAQELEPHIIRIMKSENGNHVVQKVLTKLPRDRIDFVYDAVRGRIFELSQQQYACRVIQRMIEKGTPADKAFILQEFHEVAHRLVTDNWGNYVVQAVIRQGGAEARGKVIRLCIDNFLIFSKQKVASNVMEHCIEYGTERDRLKMFQLIIRQEDDGTGLLQAMWKDNFANYVVQKLCHCLDGPEQKILVKASKPYFESRKKPSRPDEKWIAFEKLINQFSAPPSRQGSISSLGGGVNGASGSRPQSQSGSAMPTPDLTTGGNSPRTSSSQDTNDASLDRSERYLADRFGKASLDDAVEQEQLS